MNANYEEIDIDGIVLRTYPYRDAHLVLKVLSPAQGKLSLLAKSARGKSKKFPNSFDVFDCGVFKSRLSLTNPEAMGTVLEYIPARTFISIREDLHKLIAATVVCECCDCLLPDRGPECSEMFQTVNLGLQAIKEATEPKVAFKAAYLTIAQILQHEGFFNADEAPTPSAKNLLKLLDSVENSSDKEVRSKKALIEMLNELR